MSRHLPSHMESSPIFNEDFNSKEKEFDILNKKINDVGLQLNIDTATWGLKIYEKELGIITDLNKTYDDRRGVIKSKWRSNGKLDWKLIRMVADAYLNGQVDVKFDGKIHVKFNSVIGIPPNLEDLKKALEEIKPAALRIVYDFSYLLIKDVSKMTIGELQQQTLDKFAGGDRNV